MKIPGEILLSGMAGSYGLLGMDEPPDRRGIYAVPTQDLHIARTPVEWVSGEDGSFYEAALWCRVAMGCDPDAIEMLWLPSYETLTDFGRELIELRAAFLSADAVRNAYLDAATECVSRMDVRTAGFTPEAKKRSAEAAQHLLRLCWQGYHLYSTGYLPLAVDEPRRFFGFGQKVAEGHVESARAVLGEYAVKFSRTRSPLPTGPDEDAIDRWLRFVRLKFL